MPPLARAAVTSAQAEVKSKARAAKPEERRPLPELGQRFAARFEHIAATRMRDLPMCNPALRVAALGFHQIAWALHKKADDHEVSSNTPPAPVVQPSSQRAVIGVLVTPWCMNLILIPPAGSALTAPGQHVERSLPSGDYRFTGVDDEVLGRYETCSLFSPMFEFAEQQVACDTAWHALAVVLDHDLVHRELESEDQAAQAPTTSASSLNEPIQPPSRRRFLFGVQHPAHQAQGSAAGNRT